MSDKDFLVFVEVKYKSDDSLGLPEEMISRAKVNQVRRVAEWYIIEHKDICQRFSKFRLDAVCILSGKINYYSDIQS
jgi:Holliday junction resolvase-like predicted endonuclease